MLCMFVKCCFVIFSCLVFTSVLSCCFRVCLVWVLVSCLLLLLFNDSDNDNNSYNNNISNNNTNITNSNISNVCLL